MKRLNTSTRYASFPSKFHYPLMKLNPDGVFDGKLKALLAVQTRVLLFVLATAIELLYAAKALNVLNRVYCFEKIQDWSGRGSIEFTISIQKGREEEEFAELSSDRTLMINFNQKPLAPYWLSVADNYLLLSQKTTKILFSFCYYILYMCKTVFSALTNMKTKYSPELQLRLIYEFVCHKLLLE